MNHDPQMPDGRDDDRAGSGAQLFVTETSAEVAANDNVPSAWLLPVSGSGVELATVAWSLTSVPATAVTATLTVATPPAAMTPRLQLMVTSSVGPTGAAGRHVPWLGVTV